MYWWFVSFADGNRAPGHRFLGAALVQAPDVKTAHRITWIAGVNPGNCSVKLFRLPRERPPGAPDPAEYGYRFLSLAELVEGGWAPAAALEERDD